MSYMRLTNVKYEPKVYEKLKVFFYNIYTTKLYSRDLVILHRKNIKLATNIVCFIYTHIITHIMFILLYIITYK